MLGWEVYPFKPIKGQTYKFPFVGHNINGGDYKAFSWYAEINISKDYNTYASVTNSPVDVTGSTGRALGECGYLELTSTEMDADVILIDLITSGSGYGYGATWIIETAPAELSSITTINSSLAEKITAIWQYFFLKRTVTSSAMTLYKDDGATELGTAGLSDDGTTVTKGEVT